MHPYHLWPRLRGAAAPHPLGAHAPFSTVGAHALLPRPLQVVRFDIRDAESAHALFLEEAELMRTCEETQVPTTILALPNLFAEDFLEWHSFTEALADDLEVGGTRCKSVWFAFLLRTPV